MLTKTHIFVTVCILWATWLDAWVAGDVTCGLERCRTLIQKIHPMPNVNDDKARKRAAPSTDHVTQEMNPKPSVDDIISKLECSACGAERKSRKLVLTEANDARLFSAMFRNAVAIFAIVGSLDCKSAF